MLQGLKAEERCSQSPCRNSMRVWSKVEPRLADCHKPQVCLMVAQELGRCPGSRGLQEAAIAPGSFTHTCSPSELSGNQVKSLLNCAGSSPI